MRTLALVLLFTLAGCTSSLVGNWKSNEATPVFLLIRSNGTFFLAEQKADGRWDAGEGTWTSSGRKSATLTTTDEPDWSATVDVINAKQLRFHKEFIAVRLYRQE